MGAIQGAEACTTIVQRDDPHLWKTALFAPEPARSRLMVLYAFDIELSRAARASSESLIPRMRLQWWRDVIGAAAGGAPPTAHEVADPLAHEIQVQEDPAGLAALLLCMFDGHEQELQRLTTPAQWDGWADGRFGARLRAATRVLAGREAGNVSPAGKALAAAYALRNAARMAAGDRTLLPGVGPAGLAALARQQDHEEVRRAAMALARAGANALAAFPSARNDLNRSVGSAFLPLLWARRTFRLVLRDPSTILGQLDDIDRPFDGLRLAWAALSGRW